MRIHKANEKAEKLKQKLEVQQMASQSKNVFDMEEMKQQLEKSYQQQAEEYVAKQIAEREAAWKI
jgi:hypothetical protein